MRGIDKQFFLCAQYRSAPFSCCQVQHALLTELAGWHGQLQLAHEDLGGVSGWLLSRRSHFIINTLHIDIDAGHGMFESEADTLCGGLLGEVGVYGYGFDIGCAVGLAEAGLAACAPEQVHLLLGDIAERVSDSGCSCGRISAQRRDAVCSQVERWIHVGSVCEETDIAVRIVHARSPLVVGRLVFVGPVFLRRIDPVLGSVAVPIDLLVVHEVGRGCAARRVPGCVPRVVSEDAEAATTRVGIIFLQPVGGHLVPQPRTRVCQLIQRSSEGDGPISVVQVAAVI